MSPPESENGERRIGDLTLRHRVGVSKRSVAKTSDLLSEVLDEQFHTRRLLPVRYAIKEDNDGRFLTCIEASNIKVRVERGFTVSAPAARKYPRGTIFIDGAAQSEPFLDVARGIYNLDHHEGCVRAFTLATCEQAMVLILKGLDLDGERWTVYGNEPDLDTVLAIWLLLNHRRFGADDTTVRRRLLPIVRLQGVIDAHGLELKDLTAFPKDIEESSLAIIDQLRTEELEIKREGRWGAIDLLDFTLASVQKIDELVYQPHDFAGLKEIEELARVRISSDRFAVACRSEAGIYEVEESLKAVHGERLGLIILQKDALSFTLRQVDPFLLNTLDQFYERLNLFDPAVSGDLRWGGSSDIGGSPRGSGTKLSSDGIMQICRWVFRPPSPGRRLAVIGAGVAAAAVVIGLALLAAGGGSWPGFPPGLITVGGVLGYSFATIVLAVFGIGLTILGKRLLPGYFGLRRPSGYGYLIVLPVTMLAAFGGGSWVPLHESQEFLNADSTGWWFLFVLLIGVIGIESLLRGAVHGILVTSFPVMLSTGKRFVSVPIVVSALVYSAAVMVCLEPPKWLSFAGGSGVQWLLWGGASLVFGLLCGITRERWRSLWAAVVLHAASAVTAWSLLPWLSPR